MKKKKTLIITVSLTIIVAIAMLVIINFDIFRGDRVKNSDFYQLDFTLMNQIDSHVLTLSEGDTLAVNCDTPDWSAITESGLDENVFLESLDTDTLQTVATELQALVDEEIEEEKANPDIILTEGYHRVFESGRYQKVISMGERAEMPLYYIIFKSNSEGMYEHICTVALSQLTGQDFEDESGDYLKWSTSKEYLKLFNEEIIRQRNTECKE